MVGMEYAPKKNKKICLKSSQENLRELIINGGGAFVIKVLGRIRSNKGF